MRFGVYAGGVCSLLFYACSLWSFLFGDQMSCRSLSLIGFASDCALLLGSSRVRSLRSWDSRWSRECESRSCAAQAISWLWWEATSSLFVPAWAIFVSGCEWVWVCVCVCPFLPHLGCVPAASALSLVTVVPGLCDDEPIEMQYGIRYPRILW